MSFYSPEKGSLLISMSDTLPVRHCFTTRLGGVSTGILASMNLGVHRGDDPENVLENYRILGEAVGFDPEKCVCAVQVHGKAIKVARAEDWGKGVYAKADYEADGLVTCVPGTALFVYSADCGTVLLHDPVTGAVGACHAGWRGTALGIAAETVRAMVREYGARPEEIRCALGPCISKCCFETDADVPEAMRLGLGEKAEAAITKNGSKYHVDIKLCNRLFLEEAGILPEHIDISPECTACHPDRYWSARRHGNDRGSLAAVIVAGGRP